MGRTMIETELDYLDNSLAGRNRITDEYEHLAGEWRIGEGPPATVGDLQAMCRILGSIVTDLTEFRTSMRMPIPDTKSEPKQETQLQSTPSAMVTALVKRPEASDLRNALRVLRARSGHDSSSGKTALWLQQVFGAMRRTGLLSEDVVESTSGKVRVVMTVDVTQKVASTSGRRMEEFISFIAGRLAGGDPSDELGISVTKVDIENMSPVEPNSGLCG